MAPRKAKTPKLVKEKSSLPATSSCRVDTSNLDSEIRTRSKLPIRRSARTNSIQKREQSEKGKSTHTNDAKGKRKLFDDKDTLPLHDDTHTSTHHNDVQSFYDFATDQNGSLVRLCKANQTCIREGKYYYKRVQLKEHLLKVHGLEVVLPFGQTEKGRKESYLPTISAYEAQRRNMRFVDAERKFAKNRQKYYKYTIQRAHRLYEAGRPYHPVDHTPQDMWVSQYVNDKMAKYDESKESRLRDIRKDISDVVARERSSHSLSNSDIVPQFKQSPKSNIISQMTSNPSTSSFIDLSVDAMEEYPTNDIQEVSVVNGRVIRLNEISPSRDIARVRVFCERLSLSEEVTPGFVQQICMPDREVDTLLFAFFIMWLEFCCTTDIATKFAILDPWWGPLLKKYGKFKCNVRPSIPILFLPVVNAGHWSLFIVLNHKNHQIARCRHRRGCIYMDSLNRGYTREVLRRYVQVVRKIWSDDNDSRKDILDDSPTCVKVPCQPNSVDCGFYVMYMIRSFVGSCFQGLSEPNMLSSTWFDHNDVLMLKKQLQKWVAAVVAS